MKKIVIFFVFIVITFIPEIIGSYFAQLALSWDNTLLLPSSTPPNHLFAPVWIILYFLIGISGAIFWIHKRSPLAYKALIFWIIQLILNGLWTVIFFGFKNSLIAGIEITFLLIFAILTMVFAFMNHLTRIAGWLFLPYVLWLIFATYLNWMVVYLN